MNKTLGLYLHIPFCKSKCLYCDFCSFPHPTSETVETYVDALCRDVVARAIECQAYTVDTVYFGGGTPTLLQAAQLTQLLETVKKHYHVSEDAEITVECNPATGDEAYFSSLRQSGFNRISLGMQSIHAQELRALGRRHDFAQFCRTYEAVRAAGF